MAIFAIINLLESCFRRNIQIDGVSNLLLKVNVDNSIVNPDVFINTTRGTFNFIKISLQTVDGKTHLFQKRLQTCKIPSKLNGTEFSSSILEGSFKETSSYSPNSPYSLLQKLVLICWCEAFTINLWSQYIDIYFIATIMDLVEIIEKFIPKV